MDLNSDLGEGYGPWAMGDDAALLDIVTSANIACGFHAGDPTIMARTVELATERHVSIGAHVSYPDRRGFGRYDMNLPANQVRDDVLYQIGAWMRWLARPVAACTTSNPTAPCTTASPPTRHSPAPSSKPSPPSTRHCRYSPNPVEPLTPLPLTQACP